MRFPRSVLAQNPEGIGHSFPQQCRGANPRTFLSRGAFLVDRGLALIRALPRTGVSALRRMPVTALGMAAVLLLAGCASDPKVSDPARRAFDFDQDTFSYSNELIWEYHYDENGKWVSHSREPKPKYSHHCFVVARAALQFYYNARFEPDQPRVGEADYRKLIRKVASSDVRHPLPLEKRIVIPGYPNLREFSEAKEKLLKDECGSAAQSYFQRGHWRMIFPFSRSQQDEMAKQIEGELNRKGPLVVHVVRFPQLTINHAVVIFAATEATDGIEFKAYDPNHPEKVMVVSFDQPTRTFTLAPSDYFPGGRVDVYEVYYSWDY